MPHTPWFESERAQKTVVAAICGFLLLAAVSVAWAVSRAPLRTLIPVGQATDMKIADKPRRKPIKPVPKRFGRIVVNMPRQWKPTDRSPKYLLNTPHKVWQDPKRPVRWLAIARVSGPLPKPQRVTGDVDLIQSVGTSGHAHYLFHLHDHVETDAQAKIISEAYQPLFQRMVQSARPAKEDPR